MNTEIQVIGNEVIEYRIFETSSQIAKEGTHLCYTRKLVIEGDSTVAINTALPLAIHLYDWTDQHLYEEPTVTVTANKQEVEVQLVDGVAEFDFQSAMTGEFIIRVTSPNVDAGTKVVTVSG